MKRSLVLLGLVVLVAAGCGGGGTKPSAGTTTQGGKQVKVGLVPDVSGLNDRGFNHLSYVGLLRAQTELGVQPAVYHSNAQLDYLPNMTTLARKGYALTIAVGYTAILQYFAIETGMRPVVLEINAHLPPAFRFARLGLPLEDVDCLDYLLRHWLSPPAGCFA